MKTALFVLLGVASVFGESRVIGGNDAQQGQFPYVASIKVGSTNMKHVCAAVILDSFTVLTAANCMTQTAGAYTLYVGDVKLDGNGQNYHINKVLNYNRYDKLTLRHNIALVQVKGPIKFNDQTKPFKLPQTLPPNNETKCELIGWGEKSVNLINILHHATVELLNDLERCREEQTDRPVYKGQLCTSTNINLGACNGDLGSPLICNGELIGLMSFFTTPCGSGKPDLYTSIHYYLDWIEEYR